MQLLGYFISAAGPTLIFSYCYEHFLHRKNVRTLLLAGCYCAAALLLTLQTQFVYQADLNSAISIAIYFALTFFYRDDWYYRLFLCFALFVLGVLGEGVGWLLVRLFVPVDSIKNVNQLAIFPISCSIGVLADAFFVWGAAQCVRLFRKSKIKIQTVILFLVAILIFCIIDLVVTFAATRYLPLALVLVVLLIAGIAGCVYLFQDQLTVQNQSLRLSYLEQQLQDQVAHASALYAANQQVAILKHDLNNTLINIRSYLKLRQYEKLEQYLAQMQTQLQPPTLADHGMPFIDAVLSAKFENHPEIKFTEDISPLQLKHIPQTDIAMILAIALDNAIEACGQCPAPFIEIRLAQDGLILSLVITNSAVRPVRHTGDVLLTTKREKQDHGLGMKSMERIAAQNHGSLTWSCEKERFRLCVLLQDLPRDGGAAT